MSDTAWMDNLSVRCRCGQVGVISGVEGPAERPENIWVNHLVGLSMQTHIHRSAQMPSLMAQVARARAELERAESASD